MKATSKTKSSTPKITGAEKLVAISSDLPSSKVEGLNSLLANEFALFTKTLNYHWNARGMNFASVHSFLEEQYKQMLEVIDGVAERIRKLDAVPAGSLKEFQKLSSISESTGKRPDTFHMISNLASDHDAIRDQIKTLLKDLSDERDPGTEDFLTGLLKNHETMSWMLKSHLEKVRH